MGLTTGQTPFLRASEGGRVWARSLSQSFCYFDVLELKLRTQLLTVHSKGNRLSLSRLDYKQPLTSICSFSHPLHHCLTQSLGGEVAPVEWAGIDGEELAPPASGPWHSPAAWAWAGSSPPPGAALGQGEPGCHLTVALREPQTPSEVALGFLTQTMSYKRLLLLSS